MKTSSISHKRRWWWIRHQSVMSRKKILPFFTLFFFIEVNKPSIGHFSATREHPVAHYAPSSHTETARSTVPASGQAHVSPTCCTQSRLFRQQSSAPSILTAMLEHTALGGCRAALPNALSKGLAGGCRSQHALPCPKAIDAPRLKTVCSLNSCRPHMPHACLRGCNGDEEKPSKAPERRTDPGSNGVAYCKSKVSGMVDTPQYTLDTPIQYTHSQSVPFCHHKFRDRH